jgi:hypothetical protein
MIPVSGLRFSLAGISNIFEMFLPRLIAFSSDYLAASSEQKS